MGRFSCYKPLFLNHPIEMRGIEAYLRKNCLKDDFTKERATEALCKKRKIKTFFKMGGHSELLERLKE